MKDSWKKKDCVLDIAAIPSKNTRRKNNKIDKMYAHIIRHEDLNTTA